MKHEFQSLLEKCENAVRAGQVPHVRKWLGEVNCAQVPDPLRLPFANLCRRVGLAEMGLRILKPQGASLTPRELAEYAVLLQRIGSIDEALKILESLDASAHPEILLYRCFCHFNRWEYFASIPLLRSYLAAPLSDYDRLVGLVNLAAALVATDENREALTVLGEVLPKAKAGGSRRLEGNSLEIRAQANFLLDRPNDAGADLEAALRALGGEASAQELAILKWKAVLDAKTLGTIEPLTKFREQAVKFGEYEAVRHTDLHILKTKFDDQLFRHHLFGSPWLGYRDKAQRTLARVIADTRYDFGSAGGAHFDLVEAELNGKPAFPKGSKLHRALSALLADFYRPVSAGAMFARLFPGEYFDAFTSPNRVHQVLFRLRRWAADLPIEIAQTKEGYLLTLTGPMRITVPYEKRDPDAHLETFRRLSAKPTEAFTAKKMSADLSLTLSEARRFLAWAVDKKLIEKVGAGSSTVYVIPRSPLKSA